MCRPMVGSSRMKGFEFWVGERVGAVLQAAEEVRDEFHALRLAAAQRRADLAELEVVEAGVAQRFQRTANVLLARQRSRR